MFAITTQTEICPCCLFSANLNGKEICFECEIANAEPEAPAENYECPDCGGDVRNGRHGIQLDVDYFICEPEDVRADWFED